MEKGPRFETSPPLSFTGALAYLPSNECTIEDSGSFALSDGKSDS